MKWLKNSFMDPFNVHILGCGSAKPNTRHFPSCQIISYRQKLLMVDCGEGAQIQMCAHHLNFSRLSAIFISHLHGDHCYGLLGLISTLNLLGRTAQLHVYGPQGMETLFRPHIEFFNPQMTYEVVFHEHDTERFCQIYEDRSLTVSTLPMKHRIPCAGFLFREKQGSRHMRKDAVQKYEIPISQINLIKAGADLVREDGSVIPNELMTLPADPPRSYACCADTLYQPDLCRFIKGVDLLFHESTYEDDDAAKAQSRFHSTASQAACVARDAGAKKLVIGHYSSRYDDLTGMLSQARAVFEETVLANEGLVIGI